jgi:hypothetical protein
MGLMKTLDEIAIECQTDKASVFTRTYAKPKNYCVHYERAFAPLRMDPLKVIEIGAAGGESIRMWLEFFPSAHIWGIDVVEGTNPYNTVRAATDPRYTFIHADQSDRSMWECLAVDTGGNWDIICDDGSHMAKDVITSFNSGWKFVRPGGFWCIEDLGVAYGGNSIFLSEVFANHMDFLKGLVDKVNTQDGIDSITFSKELAIIRKA